jgi:hypothetical protein
MDLDYVIAQELAQAEDGARDEYGLRTDPAGNTMPEVVKTLWDKNPEVLLTRLYERMSWDWHMIRVDGSYMSEIKTKVTAILVAVIKEGLGSDEFSERYRAFVKENAAKYARKSGGDPLRDEMTLPTRY